MMKMVMMAAMAALMLAGQAGARQAGDWTLGLGLGRIEPPADNGTVIGATLDIDADRRPFVTLGHALTERLGAELMLSAPFRHQIQLEGRGTIGSFRQSPTIMSLQYHHPLSERLTPFAGIGLAHVRFSRAQGAGLLEGAALELSDEWGLALQAGLDVAVGPRGAIRTEIRWLDLQPELRLNGTDLGEARIDPVAMGLSYVLRF